MASWTNLCLSESVRGEVFGKRLSGAGAIGLSWSQTLCIVHQVQAHITLRVRKSGLILYKVSDMNVNARDGVFFRAIELLVKNRVEMNRTLGNFKYCRVNRPIIFSAPKYHVYS